MADRAFGGPAAAHLHQLKP